MFLNDDVCAVITSFFGSEDNSDKALVVELPLNDIKSNGTMKDAANHIHSLTKGQIISLNYNSNDDLMTLLLYLHILSHFILASLSRTYI